jgi:hypothetical protein
MLQKHSNTPLKRMANESESESEGGEEAAAAA